MRKDLDSVTFPSDGVCILSSNSYPISPLQLRTPLQAVSAQARIRTLVTVCCIYLPPHDVIVLDDLNSLLFQLPAPFLLIGDFIGHSALWGSDCTNSLRQQIEQFITVKCLRLLNEKAYFHEPTRTFIVWIRLFALPHCYPC
ncbi:hypothetical protein AVEN_214821-1 [Araneus ventricosus]|uniref:Endonuclease/exonuclease/phosphatase domain-containing protein n=1 Tax=Araneus ventricosus TaxID=182803 RepID=A0A4Y2M6C0_ARAVE|nr:hypothetical protein AVEN_214821-1 [Araneus ventricosus]